MKLSKNGFDQLYINHGCLQLVGNLYPEIEFYSSRIALAATLKSRGYRFLPRPVHLKFFLKDNFSANGKDG